ncbi:MAG: PEP-CTERM sorting domain-containing protein [Burkholderiales bacterium]|nr:PEP-CTERM sorting domain-containing protein [Burkholderiales bacterium]
MIRITMRLAATAFALAALQAHAAAATTKVTFSGVITSSSGISPTFAGESINGSFTVTADPAWSGDVGIPGQFLDVESARGLGASPLLVTGSAVFQDSRTLSLSSTPEWQRFFEKVARDGPSNGVDIVAQTRQGFYSPFLRVVLSQSPADCAVQCLFADPSGGLSLYQPLDLSAPGVQAGGFFGGTTAFGDYFGGFDLTSLSIVAMPVPEPSSVPMMLAGVGLLAAMTRRRRA